MKKCNTCLKEKSTIEFKKGARYVGKCLDCREKYNKQYQIEKEKHICFSCKGIAETGTNCEKCKEKHKLKSK
jgi:hypothetical protein